MATVFDMAVYRLTEEAMELAHERGESFRTATFDEFEFALQLGQEDRTFGLPSEVLKRAMKKAYDRMMKHYEAIEKMS